MVSADRRDVTARRDSSVDGASVRDLAARACSATTSWYRLVSHAWDVRCSVARPRHTADMAVHDPSILAQAQIEVDVLSDAPLAAVVE